MGKTETDILLSKWITGELTENERSQLDHIQTKGLIDKNELLDTKNIWDASASYMPDINPSNQSWSNIVEAIQAPIPKETSNQALWALPLKVAASIILLIGAWFIGRDYIFANSNLLSTSATTNIEFLELVDGSKVWLNTGATIQYPESFNKRKRKIILSGEAFFDIKKSDTPFVIETMTGEVTVLGTSFEVESSAQTTEVTVATGKVKLTSAQSGKSIFINPNEVGLHEKQSQFLSLTEVDNLNSISWHTGKFAFNDTPLDRVIIALSNHFKTKISIEDPNMQLCKFTSPLTNPDLQKTIDVIAQTFDFKVEQSDSEIRLKGGSCE